MVILSIETSCDETSLAILKANHTSQKFSFSVLAHETNSQANIHKEYGGVFPVVAKREHAKALVPLFIKTLRKASLLHVSKKPLAINEKKLSALLEKEKDLLAHLLPFLQKYKKPKIDLITVTVGPGLEPALWVGINFAQALGKVWDIPVSGTNHMEGHIYSVFAKQTQNEKFKTKNGVQKFSIPKLQYPILSLLVSGGHTELVLLKNFGKYQIVGETRDDAAGEAFDKVARMLSLPYPGGPEISKLAEKARKEDVAHLFTLPRPMMHTTDFDFSFSGLKTAVLYTIRDTKITSLKQKIALCREFEDAVAEVLVSKTLKAAQKYKATSIIVGGGVSANKHLQNILNQKAKLAHVPVLWPSKDLAGDNALMIGIAGYIRYSQNKKPRPLKADGNLKY